MNSYSRYKSLVNKHFRARLKDFRPTSLAGRFVGPKVLMNSIPKAGTNLIEQALSHFPLLHRSGFRTLGGWNEISPATLAKISSLERGGVALGHLPAHPELLTAIKKAGVRPLLMVRDPRDQIVSYVKYVTSIDKTHPAHSYFASLKNDKSRYLAAINGVDGIKSPVNETLQKYSGWLDFDAMVVRFEDIIGSLGGGNDEKQFKVICEIGDFIGISLSSNTAQSICKKIFAPTAITFRSPQVNGWREHLNDEHLDVLESKCSGLLKRYGYSS
jgi:sulfotransferase 6B1